MSSALEIPVLEISQAALNKLKETVRKEGVDLDKTFLRVAVVPGGCSGLSYDLGWDTARNESDSHFQVDDLQVLVDARSALYLEGTTLNFTEGLEGKGFHFDNPQAVRNCACGESFSL
ncbi:MAG: iron-sulfur cluster assembly accessory protein [Bacteroidetes bacterium]|nr:iron-sulfur cluster assembly accessory protein [Bacteroidota bacterium]